MSIALRPIRPEDLTAVHALCRAIETADGFPLATPLEELEEWFHDPHMNVAADTRLVEVSGSPVAWGRIWHRPSGVREERAYLIGGVAAEHRGQGVGSALLGWQIERASAILAAADPTLPHHVRAMAYDFQASALKLFERHGMKPVRWSEELLRDLEDLPEVPRLDGVEIVPWDSAWSEAARVSQNDAFADHWGSTPRDAAAWEHDIAAFGNRLDLSFLALEGGQVVGVCRNAHHPGDEAVNGRRDGWIVQVSVSRSHRKRGIASALIVRSLHAFRAAGLTHSALGVDRDNPTGAYSLYERLGYRTLTRSIVHELKV